MKAHSPQVCRHLPRLPAVNPAHLRALSARTFAAVREREARPWLGMVAVPLTMMSALIVDQWWSVPPLALAAWWWAPRDDPWAWVVGAQAGIMGTLWAVIGISALVDFPDNHVIVGLAWAAAAGLLAAASAHSRRSGGSGY